MASKVLRVFDLKFSPAPLNIPLFPEGEYGATSDNFSLFSCGRLLESEFTGFFFSSPVRDVGLGRGAADIGKFEAIFINQPLPPRKLGCSSKYSTAASTALYWIFDY